MLVLLGGEAFAQRKFATDRVKGPHGDTGTCTYSYVGPDGGKILDGPLSVSIRSYNNSDHSREYNMSVNFSNGLLNGALSSTDEYTEYEYSYSSEGAIKTKTTATGHYVNGLPHGRFTMQKIKTKGSVVIAKTAIDVVYKNGVYAGDFKVYKMKERDRGNPSLNVRCSFDKNGKISGKFADNGRELIFKNGVLVGGDERVSDARVAALANKYADKQIGLKELVANNMFVYTDDDMEKLYYGVYETFIKAVDICSVLRTRKINAVLDKKWENLPVAFEYIAELPRFTDSGFAQFCNDYLKSNESKYYDWKTFLSQCKIKKYKDTDKLYVGIVSDEEPYDCTVSKRDYATVGGKEWLYFLSDKQISMVKEIIKVYNEQANEANRALLMRKLPGCKVKIEGEDYLVTSYRVLKEYSLEKGMTIEFNGCLQKSVSQEYNTYTAVITCGNDGSINFKSITRIRNKFDDIEEAKKAFNEETKRQLDSVNKLIAAKDVISYIAVKKQLSVFDAYVAQINDSRVNYDDLDVTVKMFKEQTEIIKSFSVYMPVYIEACKLDEHIKQKRISEHTITPIPVVKDWSNCADIEALTNVVSAQQNILKLWEKFSPLKAQAVENHKQFGSGDAPVLAAYNTEYKSLVNSKPTLEAGIESYTKLLETQKVIAEQWKSYSALKEEATKAHVQIMGPSGVNNDPVLNDYKALYKATEAKTVLTEAIVAYTELLEAQKVVAEQWKSYKALKKQLVNTHKLLRDTNLSVLAEYYSWYEANFTPQAKLEQGVARYTKLVEIQQRATEYVALYKSVVENNAQLENILKPAKCAAKAYKPYYEALDLNWKVEGAVEFIGKVLKTQTQLLKISKLPDLKEVDKRVRKLKFKNLDDIINAYLGDKSVRELQMGESSIDQTQGVGRGSIFAQKRAAEVTAVLPSELKPGYSQFVELSPIMSINGGGVSVAFDLNYIGGYRLNKNIFFGLGTGVNFNLGHDAWTDLYYYNAYYYNASLSLMSVPVYFHFRADWGKRATKWNFYSSLSAGAQFGVYEPYGRFEKSIPALTSWLSGHKSELYTMLRSNGEMLFGVDLGANYRLGDKMSLYMGVGFKYGLRTSYTRIIWDPSEPYRRLSIEDKGMGINIPSVKLKVGLAF